MKQYAKFNGFDQMHSNTNINLINIVQSQNLIESIVKQDALFMDLANIIQAIISIQQKLFNPTNFTIKHVKIINKAR
jgi:hypothetical protein